MLALLLLLEANNCFEEWLDYKTFFFLFLRYYPSVCTGISASTLSFSSSTDGGGAGRSLIKR